VPDTEPGDPEVDQCGKWHSSHNPYAAPSSRGFHTCDPSVRLYASTGTLGPILARLGLGARLVAPFSAAHALSCGSHLARAGEASLRLGEAQEVLCGSKQRCPPGFSRH
jgi:hypothetical protein